MNVEQTVCERYSAAARARESALCCPIEYDRKHLEAIPEEIIQKDYGCGDPSKYLNPGETVLDLGSGAGKICFIASQVVGPAGKVIGVDMNDDMLALARKHRQRVGEAIGWHNVEFRKGRIQDLALDLELLENSLRRHPVQTTNDFLALESTIRDLRANQPLIAGESIDVVVSNCVLNLVDPNLKGQLFQEIHRVLRPGGRAVISDIVSDEPVPESMRRDPELWSGCISGALTEAGFLNAFADAGFHGMEILRRDENPWRTVEGIEFRSYTVAAYKDKTGPCQERNQAVIYKGPFQAVTDDDGHVFPRGQRHAVCDKIFQRLRRPPYQTHFEFVPPREEIPPVEAGPFDCARTAPRDPRETKGANYHATTKSSACCSSGEC